MVGRQPLSSRSNPLVQNWAHFRTPDYHAAMPNGCEKRPVTMRPAGLFIGLGLLLSGCPEPTVSKSPDPSRAMGPVPACVKNLPRSNTESGFVRQLPEDELWGLVVPDFQDGSAAPNASTPACNGEPVFGSENFEGASFDPDAVQKGRITYGGGANRIKVAWLRTHETKDGLQAGPLALIRTVEGHSEVYGVGSFRGEPEKSRFNLERLGGEVVVTAVSDGCSGAERSAACDTELTVFRPVAGRLEPIAQIGLQRVRHATGLEPGVSGRLRVQLVSSPAFEKDGIHVVEEVSVTDETGRKLRRAELERKFLLDGDEVRPTLESLWDRLYASRVEGPQSEAAPANAKTAPGEGAESAGSGAAGDATDEAPSPDENAPE